VQDKGAEIQRDTRRKDRIAGDDAGLMTKAKDALRRKRLQLAAKLKELEVWQNVGRQEHEEEARYTEAHVSAMLRGEPPPWDASHGVSHISRTIRHGRLIYRAEQALARCNEQLQVLPVELARYKAWAAHVCARVDAAMVELQQGGATPDSAQALEGVAALRDAGCRGKLLILEEHRQWLQAGLKRAAEVQREWGV
jgi:hypothetical protein